MAQPCELNDRLTASLHSALKWVIAHDYRGYEPADGNLSPLHVLTAGRVLPMRVLQQVVLRSPFNIRPLLGIAPHTSAIGRGYLAWACTIASGLVPADSWLATEARRSFDWLMAHPAAGYRFFCWGDPYEYATRSGRRPYGEPLLIWSSLIGQAFLDGYERFKVERYLEIAVSVGDWILSLPAERTSSGLCLSYVAYRQSSIHNSNMMGAAMLAWVGQLTRDERALSTAKLAMAYSCAAQRPDGAWFYAEEPKFHWVDNFHTGYNLSALRKYRDCSGDRSFDHHLRRGLDYYKQHFFEADGRPRYFDNATDPIDIQCAAQSIDTLATLADMDDECLPLACRVAEWTISRMQDGDGHFYYRYSGGRAVKTPMLHWGQGTMAKALAVLLERLTAAEPPADTVLAMVKTQWI